MRYFFWFLLSLILTKFSILSAHRNGVIDIPNARSSHTIPTPRGGGVVFVIGFCLLLLSEGTSPGFFQFPLLIASIAVGLIGAIDDFRGLSPKMRLAVHLASAFCIVLFFIPDSAPWVWLQRALFLLGLAWSINLFNFMDGIDGIASVEAISILINFGALLHGMKYVGFESQLIYGLIATIAGFLVFNFPPAKIFMGDVGSGFLGLVLGALAIWMTFRLGVGLPTVAILFGVFCVDATQTLFVRLISRKRIYEAHCDHAYQHAVRSGIRAVSVDGAVVLLNHLWILPCALVAQKHPSFGWPLVILAYLPLIFIASRFKAGRTLEA